MTTIRKPAPCVSILGTGSDVGKSIVATALCRIYRNMGLSVAPFKAQNMSNNSGVTADGGEMGRAQIVQAQAAGIEPHVDMNPVLLKPSSNTGSQVILQGKPVFSTTAAAYYKRTDDLFEKSLESLARLRQQYDLIVMEGAGSCGEVNLRERDFVNYKTARSVDAPVLLVADIDRGGVFAQLLGTLLVSSEQDRSMVKGFIINRFRGDPTLFDDGIAYLEQEAKRPVLGLIPYYTDIKIDSEDSVLLSDLVDPPAIPDPETVNIAVLRFPHISNFTDFSPLENDPGVSLHYLSSLRRLDGYDLLILPGSKNVRSDLNWLTSSGWFDAIHRYAKGGGELAGICGGYQMLGRVIHDPNGVEGAPGSDPGLDLLDLETVMASAKTLTRSTGTWQENGLPVSGYEIHMGTTRIGPGLKPAISCQTRNGEPAPETDGVISADGKIWGTYFHGLFDNSEFRTRMLQRLSPSYRGVKKQFQISAFRDQQYELLAAHFRRYLDITQVSRIIGVE